MSTQPVQPYADGEIPDGYALVQFSGAVQSVTKDAVVADTSPTRLVFTPSFGPNPVQVGDRVKAIETQLGTTTTPEDEETP